MFDEKYIDSYSYTHENHTLKSVASIVDDLNNGENLRAVRKDIADLIEQCLYQGKETSNFSALPHLINAVGSLTLNVNSKNAATPVGLYSCLKDIEKALANLERNAEPIPLRVQNPETITYDFLIEALQAIRRAPKFNSAT